jgi:hypothetical protein
MQVPWPDSPVPGEGRGGSNGPARLGSPKAALGTCGGRINGINARGALTYVMAPFLKVTGPDDAIADECTTLVGYAR